MDKATRTSIKNAHEHKFEITRRADQTDTFTIKDLSDDASGDTHTLTLTESGTHCTCKGFEYRGDCKHVKALNLWFLNNGVPECAKPFKPVVEA